MCFFFVYFHSFQTFLQNQNCTTQAGISTWIFGVEGVEVKIHSPFQMTFSRCFSEHENRESLGVLQKMF